MRFRHLLMCFAISFAGAFLAMMVFLNGRFDASGQDGGTALLDQWHCADPNGDGNVDIGDPITLLTYLFAGGNLPHCAEAGVDWAAELEDLERRVTTLEEKTSFYAATTHDAVINAPTGTTDDWSIIVTPKQFD